MLECCARLVLLFPLEQLGVVALGSGPRRLDDAIDESRGRIDGADRARGRVDRGPVREPERLRDLVSEPQYPLDDDHVLGGGKAVGLEQHPAAKIGAAGVGEDRTCVGVVGGQRHGAVGIGRVPLDEVRRQPLQLGPVLDDHPAAGGAAVPVELVDRLRQLVAQPLEPLPGGLRLVDAGEPEVPQLALDVLPRRRIGALQVDVAQRRVNVGAQLDFSGDGADATVEFFADRPHALIGVVGREDTGLGLGRVQLPPHVVVGPKRIGGGPLAGDGQQRGEQRAGARDAAVQSRLERLGCRQPGGERHGRGVLGACRRRGAQAHNQRECRDGTARHRMQFLPACYGLPATSAALGGAFSVHDLRRERLALAEVDEVLIGHLVRQHRRQVLERVGGHARAGYGGRTRPVPPRPGAAPCTGRAADRSRRSAGAPAPSTRPCRNAPSLRPSSRRRPARSTAARRGRPACARCPGSRSTRCDAGRSRSGSR